jgi:hypothetical protein
MALGPRRHCDCEHIKHENDDPHHWELNLVTRPVKLIYGTYQLCKPCEENCYGPEHKE